MGLLWPGLVYTHINPNLTWTTALNALPRSLAFIYLYSRCATCCGARPRPRSASSLSAPACRPRQVRQLSSCLCERACVACVACARRLTAGCLDGRVSLVPPPPPQQSTPTHIFIHRSPHGHDTGEDGIELTLTRRLVRVPDVKLTSFLGQPSDGIGYIQLASFSQVGALAPSCLPACLFSEIQSDSHQSIMCV